jgi:4-carboxymuconolactone decarboxylase
MYREVYGDDAPLPDGDANAEFFELLIIDQQFSEVWSRRALPIPMRRLLNIGVLAAMHRFEILEFQFTRCLSTGELTPEQVREVVIHLVGYVGTPVSGDLYQAGERAIAGHVQRASGAATDDADGAANGAADGAAGPGAST